MGWSRRFDFFSSYNPALYSADEISKATLQTGIQHVTPPSLLAADFKIGLPASISDSTQFSPANVTDASWIVSARQTLTDIFEASGAQDFRARFPAVHHPLPDTANGETADAGRSDTDPDGQLWVAFGGNGIGNPDTNSDFRVEHLDDSAGTAGNPVIQQQQSSSGMYTAIGLDTTANLSITLDGSLRLHVTNLTTGIDLSST
ncbi:MAG TPA: hypothetical protein VGG36_04980, partial [Rhizomicrobium sp.]